ncbi:putative oxidoreductase C2F3.05c [Lasiodiplodia hormozganensis]|uniref:Oxidoreductase C2F3.05c n=1 Tax=Lasiodiplodia hormozganensis TaxID=869390 RepID=A0AA39XYA0_9PEZI|nr:putative oxidoreductase C2F3.05c [Lasiodiplodia hormozganensis]
MAVKLSIASTLPLLDSPAQLPRLGFGVYKSTAETCVRSCLTALKAGYRHIDTAQFYANEEQVGQAVKESGIPRSEIYITSKVMTASSDVPATYEKIVDSVRKLDDRPDGYVDLFLIHNASISAEGNKIMWAALEQAKAEGKVKDIGVSNAGKRHIEAMKDYAKVWPPVVNQIELHPWNQQREAVKYSQSQGIVVEAYCPLVRNLKADDKTLLSIAEKHNKTTAQVLVRYCLQKDWVPLPKSDTPSRIEANADVFGFELDAKDMETLDNLDQGPWGAIVQAVDN